jgi:hypothetical protein
MALKKRGKHSYGEAQEDIRVEARAGDVLPRLAEALVRDSRCVCLGLTRV